MKYFIETDRHEIREVLKYSYGTSPLYDIFVSDLDSYKSSGMERPIRFHFINPSFFMNIENIINLWSE